MIKLVAFDWNGTLIDDMDLGTSSESATRVAFGFPATNVDEIREHFQIPIRQYWINAGLTGEFFDQHTEEINQIYVSHYEPGEDSLGLRENVSETLAVLKTQNVSSIIFSNHSVPHIEKQCLRLGINSYFDKILARGSLQEIVHHGRNFKDELLAAYLKANHILPREVVVVGDTNEEIEIAHKYGYVSVALTGGWQNEKRLVMEKPDYLIHKLKELATIIKEINGRTTSTN